MNLMKIGVPALGKRPQQIQRRCRLVVHLYHAFGIRNAAGFGKRHVIDHVAPIGKVTPFCSSTSEDRGLANCPARRPTFTTGLPDANVSTTAICSNTRNVSWILLGWNSRNSLRSPRPAAKRFAFRHVSKLGTQLARLTGKHQRRIVSQLVFRSLQGIGIRIFRNLNDRLVSPAFGQPVPGHASPPINHVWRVAYTRFIPLFPAKPRFGLHLPAYSTNKAGINRNCWRTGKVKTPETPPNQWVPDKILQTPTILPTKAAYLATVERNSDEPEISITNTGIGIAMTSEKVRRDFRTLRAGRQQPVEKHKGTGLSVSHHAGADAVWLCKREIKSAPGLARTAPIILPARRVRGAAPTETSEIRLPAKLLLSRRRSGLRFRNGLAHRHEFFGRRRVNADRRIELGLGCPRISTRYTPCGVISPASGPTIWQPTTRSDALSTMSFIIVCSDEPVSVSFRARNVDR